MGLRLGSVIRESYSGSAHVRIVALRYGAGSVLIPHQHEEPYVSVLVDGKYTEVCGANLRRCDVGAVIAHEGGEEHADYFPTDGICVNIYANDRSGRSARAVGVALAARRPRDWNEAFDVIDRVTRSAYGADDVLRPLPTPPSWLQRVLREFNWTGTASLHSAAECGGVHPAHLARAFRSYLGMTPSAYRHRARVNAASAQLMSTSASLAQIAAETGFYDQSDFTHRFFDASGLTPARFRSIFRR